jgi:hypothetical protein
MNRQGHEDTKFFYGTEVEHTPAFGMPTLFVVGVQQEEWIGHHLNGRGHIYFGANQSFPNIRSNDAVQWERWENMILPFLETEYLCTLDIDVSCVEGLVESRLVEYRNFIPMISVKMPYIRQLGYNATLKLDDKDFAATNPGVWCHSIHDLQNWDHFTDWSKYTKDETL